MDDALVVGILHGQGHVAHNLGGQPRGQRSGDDLFAQAVAVDQFEGEEWFAVMRADFVDVDDVGMLEPGHRLGLGAKAGQIAFGGEVPGQDHLKGHEPVEPVLAGLVNHTHAATAQDVEDVVARHVRQANGFRVLRRQGRCLGIWEDNSGRRGPHGGVPGTILRALRSHRLGSSHGRRIE